MLQHPLTPRGKKIWLGDEGFDSSQQLIAAAVEASGRLVLSNASGKRGILRLVTKGDKQRRYCSPVALFFLRFTTPQVSVFVLLE